MSRGTVASLGVTATVLACLAAGLPAAQANPSGTAAVFGDWTSSHYTEWTTHATPPADPDGQAGEDNLANVEQVGELHTKWVPGASNIEYSAWVTEKPEGEGWDKYDVRTVTDMDASPEQVLVSEAVPATPGFWTNFQPNDIHAPFDGPPSYPQDSRGTWSAPKVEGGPQQDASGVYQNGNGHGSWFYRSTGTPAIPAVYETVEHEAVTHEEVRFVRTVTTQGHNEYRWEILERTNTPAEPDVENPTEPEVENTSDTEVESTSDTEPLAPNGPAVSNTALKPSRPSDRSRAVPLSIDAGL